MTPIKHMAYDAVGESKEPEKRKGAKVLRSYRSLSLYLSNFRLLEREVLMMMGLELDDKNRTSVLLRLHQRLCALRRDREREDLLYDGY